MLMLLDIFAALLAVSAAVVWLSARGELSPTPLSGESRKRRMQ
jgi:hypothetical protein